MARSLRRRRVLGAGFALAVLLLGACGSSSSRSSSALSAPGSPIVAGGGRFSADLAPSGRLLTWGHNSTGELGDGTQVTRAAPMEVRGLPPGAHVVSIAAGSSHMLALLSDGSVWAWGHNRSGQLGDGTRVDRLTPVRVKGLHDVRALGAGNAFSVALEADDTVLAWGNNQSGQLGNGNAPVDHSTPAPVHGLGKESGAIDIEVGDSQALVLKSDGSVWAWGNGTSGELGDGKNDKRSAPVQVVGLGPGSGVVAIAAGGSHGIALKKDGTVVAWGNNKSGQLGDGTRPADHNVPVQVKGLGASSNVVDVAAGDAFGLALKRDGSVLAWGKNKVGELGDGATDDQSTPIVVKGLGPGVIAIAAGAYHVLALKNDGSVWAWGDNSSGQLGTGAANPAFVALPVKVRLP
jgi:alpha-tubulin suppressor-like RCC1 family protein